MGTYTANLRDLIRLRFTVYRRSIEYVFQVSTSDEPIREFHNNNQVRKYCDIGKDRISAEGLRRLGGL